MQQSMGRSAILTLVGAVMIQIGASLISLWGNCNVYFFSYFLAQGQNITKTTNSLIGLAIIIPSGIFILLAARLAKIVGYTRIIKIASLIFFCAPLFVNFLGLTTFTFSIFCLLLPVTAFCVISIALVNCIWSQFPNSTNKTMSLGVFSFGLGSIGWNLLFLYIVNPRNDSGQIHNEMVQFGQIINSRVYNLIRLLYLICGGMLMIGSLLVSRVDSQTQQQQSTGQANPRQTQIPLSTLLQAIKTPFFLKTVGCSICFSLYYLYLAMNYKLMYMPAIKDDRFLNYSMILMNVCGIGFSFLWGFIGDYKKFTWTLLVLTISDLAFKTIGIFAISKTDIIIMFVLLGATQKGMATLMGPGFVEYFGLNIATELLPFKAATFIFSFIFAALLQLIFSSILSIRQMLIVFQVISLGSCIFAWSLHSNYNQQKEKSNLELDLQPINNAQNNQ